MENQYIVIAFVIFVVIILYFGKSQNIEGFDTDTVTAKKLVSDNIVCNNNIITKNMYTKGDLVIDKNLHVNGNIYLKKGNVVDLGGIGLANSIDHYCVFNPEIGNPIIVGRSDGNILTKKGGKNLLLPPNWNKENLIRKRPIQPTITV